MTRWSIRALWQVARVGSRRSGLRNHDALRRESASRRLSRAVQGKFGMIKSDLVWRIRHQSPHLRLQDAEKIVDAIFDEIIASLARGKRVELRGFGTFSVKVHKARTGRNPRTGALVPVPKKVHPHFKTGKEMKERLNRKPVGG
jgi:integration host factor subunit beta